MTTQEKCEAILKKMLEIVNEDLTKETQITLCQDWGGNSLTLYIKDMHTHCGDPEDEWDVLVNNVYNALQGGPGLSFA